MYLIFKKDNVTNWMSPVPNYTASDFDAVTEVEVLPNKTENENYDIQNGQLIVIPKPVSELLENAKAKKLKELQDYDTSAEVNSFIINSNPMWLNSNMRTTLLRRLNAESAENTSAFASIGISTVNRLRAIELINYIELYASKCWDVTNVIHAQNIKALTTIADIEEYNYKTGYPDKIDINV